MLVQGALRTIRFLAVFHLADVMSGYFIRSPSNSLTNLRIAGLVMRVLSGLSSDPRRRPL